MKSRIYQGIIWFLVYTFLFPTAIAGDAYECRAVLNWIYRDLTMENLDKSFNRTLQKFLLNLYTVHKNTKKGYWGHSKELEKIFKTLESLDGNLKPFIQNNGLVNQWNSRWRSPYLLKDKSLKGVFNAWKKLQKEKPHYFNGLAREFLLDDWDELTINTLERLDHFHISDTELKNKLNLLSQNLFNSKTKVLDGKEFNDDELKKIIKSSELSLANSLSKTTLGLLNDFEKFCPDKDMFDLLTDEQIACELVNQKDDKSLSLKLIDLYKTLDKTEALNIKPEESQLSLEEPTVKVHHLDYPKSPNPKVQICKRGVENIKMIAIHHTSTKREATPFDINQMHLNRSTDNDPWYMMGYNYLVSDSYGGATSGSPKVFEGRPANIQGAHAGGKLFTPSKEEIEIYKNRNIVCGEVYGESKTQTVAEKILQDGGIKGNFFAFGIAVIGNYSPVEDEVTGGITVPSGLIPDYQQYPSPQIIEKVAKLSCMLQKQNPGIETLVPHSYFKKATDCPGNLKQALKLIAQRASSYGCNFNVELKRGDGKHE